MLDGFFDFQFRTASPDEPGSCVHFVYTRSFTIFAVGIRTHGETGFDTVYFDDFSRTDDDVGRLLGVRIRVRRAVTIYQIPEPGPLGRHSAKILIFGGKHVTVNSHMSI